MYICMYICIYIYIYYNVNPPWPSNSVTFVFKHIWSKSFLLWSHIYSKSHTNIIYHWPWLFFNINFILVNQFCMGAIVKKIFIPPLRDIKSSARDLFWLGQEVISFGRAVRSSGREFFRLDEMYIFTMASLGFRNFTRECCVLNYKRYTLKCMYTPVDKELSHSAKLLGRLDDTFFVRTRWTFLPWLS